MLHNFWNTRTYIYIYKKGKIHSGAIFIGFDSFQPLSPFELENNRRLMLRPPRLLKRITAFNNPTFAKISQRSRITFAAANQRARSHCFADHLFLPGVTFAKMEARYYGSPHCFRGKRQRVGEAKGRRNVRIVLFRFRIFFFFPFPSLFPFICIYLSFFPPPRPSWKSHRTLVAGDISQGVVGHALLDLPVRGEKGLLVTNPSLRPTRFDEQSPF